MNTRDSLGTACLSRGYVLSHQLSSYKVFSTETEISHNCEEAMTGWTELSVRRE